VLLYSTASVLCATWEQSLVKKKNLQSDNLAKDGEGAAQCLHCTDFCVELSKCRLSGIYQISISFIDLPSLF
jgi:hypothetical protein